MMIIFPGHRPPPLPPKSQPVPTIRPPPPSTGFSLPRRQIPGSHGWAVVGPMRDRLEYFWLEGPEGFFRKRMEKYGSTVFRTNVPPSFPAFVGVNPRMVAVLDVKSFGHLLDMEVVEKRNTLVGDFMPSVDFTGGVRTCVYLDTSEPHHAQIKSFAMDILKRSSKVWITELFANLDVMWDAIDTDISQKGSATYLVPLQKCLFNFLTKSIVGADTANSPEIKEFGYAMIDKWLGLQLLPIMYIEGFQPLVEILFHSFAYPFFLVRRDYNKLVNFVKKEGKEVLERGKKEFGLSENDCIHNILFILGFNAFGGFSVHLPSLIGTIASDTTGLQKKIRNEARQKGGPSLTFDSVKEMPLIQSVVFESLRLNPPVPMQYGRARKDFELSSHDSLFAVKKGELLCGYQPLVMRDSRVFDEPESFKPERFMGQGSELLSYLYWSNGPQTGSPTESNKQCAGKDYVPLTSALILAYLFRRYDSITGDSTSITAVQKAT